MMRNGPSWPPCTRLSWPGIRSIPRQQKNCSASASSPATNRSRRPTWLRAARQHALARRAEGIDLSVLGHGHWLGWWPEGLVCLGDWLHWRSYLEIAERPRLRRFVEGAETDPVLAEGPVGALPRLGDPSPDA